MNSGLFSSSGFVALIVTRRFMGLHGVSWEAATKALHAINPDFASSNLGAALVLQEKVPSLDFNDVAADLRVALDALIESERPWWRKLFPSGRNQVLAALTDDERQILADAGLLEVPPSPSVMAWWYQIQARVRAETNVQLSEQGGDAELATLAFERGRLISLGLNLEPVLVGFENNALGYDVRSFDLGPVEPVSRLIEVKSSVSSPPRMVLPRSEWVAALQYGSAFFFYIWWGPQLGNLSILTVPEVSAHIPHNQGDGHWMDVEIKFEEPWLLARLAT